MALVAGRELRETFRSRAFWVTIAFVLAAVAASIVLPRIFGGDTTYKVGLGGETPAGFEPALEASVKAFDADLELTEIADAATAEEAVDGDDVEVAIVFGADGAVLVRRSNSSETLVGIVNQVVAMTSVRAELGTAGLDSSTIESALAPAPPRLVVVDGGDEGRSAVAWGISFLLYIAIFMGGMSVAQAVATEKSTRIAEVLVTTVRPMHLLAGKVLGIGVSTLLIVLVAVLPFSAAIAVGLIDVPAAAAADVIMAIGWFLLGYAIYATGFGVTGALVDRQEDLGGAIAPFSTAIVLAYFASMQALGAPESALARFTSLFPFTAPMVMPVRISDGSVSLMEVAAAVALGLATLYLLARVGGTIYRKALLRGGQRLKIRELLRA